MPEIGGDDGVIEKLMNLKKAGVIRHFGVTTESIEVALSVLTSDAGWETVQFPFNILSTDETEILPAEYEEANIGFIVVPVWGPRTLEELRQILYFTQNPPFVDEKFLDECRNKRQFYN